MEPAEKMAAAALAVLVAVVVNAHAEARTLAAVVVILPTVSLRLALAQCSDICAAAAALDCANHGMIHIFVVRAGVIGLRQQLP
jgi:hypothetical protein